MDQGVDGHSCRLHASDGCKRRILRGQVRPSSRPWTSQVDDPRLGIGATGSNLVGHDRDCGQVGVDAVSTASGGVASRGKVSQSSRGQLDPGSCGGVEGVVHGGTDIVFPPRHKDQHKPVGRRGFFLPVYGGAPLQVVNDMPRENGLTKNVAGRDMATSLSPSSGQSALRRCWPGVYRSSSPSAPSTEGKGQAG